MNTVLTVFVIIAAVALAIQAVILIGLAVAAGKIYHKVEEARGEIKQPLNQVLEIIASLREPVRTTAANVAEVSRIIRERTSQTDVAIGELAVKTRSQLARVEELIESLVTNVESTANAIQRGVVSPVREAYAVIKGVQTTLDCVFSRRRPSTVREATQDEEMFI